MLINLPVARSSGARFLFLGTAVLTAAIAWWSKDFGSTHAASRLTPPFVQLFTLFDYPASVWALLMVVAAAFVPQKYSFRPLLLWIADHTWLIAGVVCVVLCICTRVFYLDFHPTQDETAPYFQSRIFAAGHLAGQVPPGLIDQLVPRVFQWHFYPVSHTTGRIAESYWPAFALLLTPFTFLGIPWACNPVISALTLPVMHRLALRLFADRETAGLVVLLTLGSPVFFADGISFYSMSAHLLANSVFALLLLDPTPRRALAAGVVGSIALTLHNPVPHMLFAIPWMLAIARSPGAAKRMGCLLAGYLPLGVLLGVGWVVFVGGIAHDDAATTVGTVTADGPLTSLAAIFSFPDSSILLARWIGVVKVWVWAVPGAVLLAVVGAWKWRHNPYCRVLTASALVTLLGYVLVPVDQGHGWGYRYFHSAWMVVPLLAAGALARVPVEPTPLGRLIEEPGVRTYLVACALLSLTLGCGLRAVQIWEFVASDMSATLPAYSGTEHRVVLMKSEGGRNLAEDDPWLRGNAVYLLSRGAEADAAMMSVYFPGLRRVFSDAQGSVWSAAPGPGSDSPSSNRRQK